MLQNAKPPSERDTNHNQDQPTPALNEETGRLLEVFKGGPSTSPGGSPLHVNNVVSRMASFYEKIRNAIDYRDEHLLRKNAIERIVKRLIALGRRKGVAHRLIRELIQARYLPNDEISERRIEDVQRILDKYFAAIDKLPAGPNLTDRQKMVRWMLSLASVEVEEALSPAARQEDALVEYAYTVLNRDVVLADESITEQEKSIQVYLAIHRALLKSDVPILSYHMVNHYYPTWKQADEELIANVAQHAYQIREAVELHLFHRVGHDLQRRLKRYMMLFHILKDVIEEDPRAASDVLAVPERSKRAITEAATRRYQNARRKLWGRITRSVIYILITKTILAFLVELPYELYFLAEVNLFPLAVNILFFPLLLLFLALTIRIPAQKNTERIIYGVSGIIYRERNTNLFAALRKPIKRSPLMTTGFRLFYLVTFLLSFGLIIWALRELGFNFVSMLLFLFFLSVVSFVGLRIRIITQELVVVAQRESGLSILVDFFTLPVVSVGRWISEKAPRINVIIFVMDYLLEAPFKIAIQFIEGWIAFMREKKEEIY